MPSGALTAGRAPGVLFSLSVGLAACLLLATRRTLLVNCIAGDSSSSLLAIGLVEHLLLQNVICVGFAQFLHRRGCGRAFSLLARAGASSICIVCLLGVCSCKAVFVMGSILNLREAWGSTELTEPGAGASKLLVQFCVLKTVCTVSCFGSWEAAR